jgi:hypothetical protein
VDLFAPGATSAVPGKVIDYDLENDVALVAILPKVEVTSVPVAPPNYQTRSGAPVFSIGCDRGADPSIRESHVTTLNKYIGPPNIEVAGQPVIGRSGGGLFSADGTLIGVCNLADPTDDEGIYAATSLLHACLDENNLAWVYKGTNTQVAATRSPKPRAGEIASHQPPEMPKQMPSAAMADRRLETIPATAPAAAVPPAEPLLADASGDTEIICIVRSKRDPKNESRVIYLDQPTTDFMDWLARECESRSGSAPVVLQASRTGSTQSPRSSTTESGRGSIVRAQTD